MAVYVDNMLIAADVQNGNHVVRGRWSHLMADTREELDEFADKLGLRRSWIQHPGEWHEHYDVVATKRALAIKLGAVSIGAGDAEWVALTNRKRQALGMNLVGNGSLVVETDRLW